MRRGSLESRFRAILGGLPKEPRFADPPSAKYDDELDVSTTGALLSPVRVRFSYDVVRSGDGAVLASGHTVHASIDRDGRPRRLPARIRDLLA